MNVRTAALAAGLGLAVAMAAWIPATPALAREESPLICLPVLLTCPKPSPGPSGSAPTPTPTPSGPLGGILDPLAPVLGPVLGPILGGGAPLGGLGGSGSSGGSGSDTGSGPIPLQLPLTLDEQAPVFTQPAAQMGAQSLEISGLHSLNLVLVRTVDGAQVPVIRIIADRVAIGGFTLDVRRDASGPAAVNTSDRMEVDGDVHVYLQSLSATLPGGGGISLLAPTPLPGDELPPTLLGVSFGLVGVTADSSVWTQTDLRLHTDG